jgi:hypothetical protein
MFAHFQQTIKANPSIPLEYALSLPVVRGGRIRGHSSGLSVYPHFLHSAALQQNTRRLKWGAIMPSTSEPTLHVRVVCTELPGIRFVDPSSSDMPVKEPVHLGVQKGNDVIDTVPADAKRAVFDVGFRVARQPNGKPNFLGPFAHGTPADRFFYLSWGVGKGDTLKMFRRLKIRLGHLTWDQIDRSIKSKKPLTVMLKLTDKYGCPLCATPPAEKVKWDARGMTASS